MASDAPIIAIKGGAPTPEQAAAIVAALETVWSDGTIGDATEAEPLRWRFSGRWWTKPVSVRRGRPD